MSKRIASIDVLRGITIFMMVLSSTIAWNAGLPAFMFHGQVPPPDYVFNPDIKGITWVDLVFPFFIFSMGASMPFSMGRRLAKGVPLRNISLSLVKRWLILAAYGVVLGNAAKIGWSGGWAKDLVRLGIWIGLFLTLWRVPQGRIKGWLVNLIGAVVIVVMLVVEKFAFDVTLSVHNNDIIIMVLSTLALVGGFLWLLTRNKLLLRLGILVVIAVLKEIDWQFHCLDFLEIPSWAYWLFNWRYAQYLVISLVGMTVGDLLMKANDTQAALCDGARNWKTILAALICVAMVPALLWAFFTRNLWPAMDITIVGALAYILLTWGDRTTWTTIARMGFALLALGVVFDPIDGGITKDHCNLCYMLSTGGLACLSTAFLLWCETLAAVRGKRLNGLFSMTGQNPMIAYTVTGFIIGPLFALIPGLNGWINEIASSGPVAGTLRGVFFCCLMMGLTSLFTKNKIYWRS